MDGTVRKRAIVLGGSIGGLLAARVLADHYREVIVVERDVFPGRGEHRRGVPQGRHTHGLLAGGYQVLRRLFPDITRSLVEAGAIESDVASHTRWFLEGGCLQRSDSGMDGILVSRPFLEGVIRERVFALPNVVRRDGTDVEGLLSNANGTKVTGIRLRSETLEAELTIDCTGRGSRSPQWLESLGYDRPVEERIEVLLSYVSRQFRRRPEQLDGDLAAVIPPTPEGKRGGVIAAQENGSWIVTLISRAREAAPEDLEGFIEYSRTLPAPYIYDVIQSAEPIGPAASSRFSANVRRRYEQLARFPEGYLVFGDALCGFNPVYGQGMSVAALEADILAGVLGESTNQVAERFFRGAAKVIEIPWRSAVASDLRMPETSGPRPAAVRLTNWYIRHLHRAAHADRVVAKAFHEVANLLASPLGIFRIGIAARVLWRNLVACGVRTARVYQAGEISRVPGSRFREILYVRPAVRA
jgi:2-polyprenyl-6-methoxyphenol hydroxylase-like FAD-dependent oxidoreductase